MKPRKHNKKGYQHKKAEYWYRQWIKRGHDIDRLHTVIDALLKAKE